MNDIITYFMFVCLLGLLIIGLPRIEFGWFHSTDGMISNFVSDSKLEKMEKNLNMARNTFFTMMLLIIGYRSYISLQDNPK